MPPFVMEHGRPPDRSLSREEQRVRSPRPTILRSSHALFASTILASVVLSLGCRSRSSGVRSPEIVPPQAVASTAVRDTSSTIEVLFVPREALLPLVRIEINDGTHARRLSGRDLPRVEGGNAWRTSFEIAAPTTLHIRAALVDSGQASSTLASVTAPIHVLAGRGYAIMIRVSDQRQCCWMVDTVVAAPFRPGTAPRPGDSLFVSWGYYIKGGPPS